MTNDSLNIIPKEVSWGTDNNTVLVLAGKHYKKIADLYGICVLENGISLSPHKYLSIYNDKQDVIDNLYEIFEVPIDNVSRSNYAIIGDIKANESKIFDEWLGEKKIFRLLKVKKIKEIPPIINDYYSEKYSMIRPFTCGSPRSVSYTSFNKARKTSELKTKAFVDDCPPPVIEEEPEEIVVVRSFFDKYKYFIIAGVVLIGVGVFWYFNPREIVNTKVIVKDKLIYTYPINLYTFYFERSKDVVNEKQIEDFKGTSYLRIDTLLNRDNKAFLLLKGYADKSGDDKKNLLLSMKRNSAIKKLLIDMNIDSSRILMVDYGSKELKGLDLKGKDLLDRRVELILDTNKSWNKYVSN